MSRPRLLLVDDEADAALIVGRVARRAGFDFAHAADGPSALSAVGGSRPELVLLDINLPGMSGLELLIAAREDESLLASNFALFCHLGMRDDIASGWAAGADYLVPKDLLATPDALQGRLSEIFAHRDGRAVVGPLTCPSSPEERLTCDWATILDSALLLSAGRALGDEVFGRVLSRAFVRGFGTDSWLIPNTPHLAPDRMPGSVARNSLSRMFASLADQFWCLLGTDASAPLMDRIRDAHGRSVGRSHTDSW